MRQNIFINIKFTIKKQRRVAYIHTFNIETLISFVFNFTFINKPKESSLAAAVQSHSVMFVKYDIVCKDAAFD